MDKYKGEAGKGKKKKNWVIDGRIGCLTQFDLAFSSSTK